MAIERRLNRKQYVYRSVRIGHKVVKRYLGTLSDPVTAIMVRADRLANFTRAADKHEAQIELDAYAALEPVLRFLSTRASRLMSLHRACLRRRVGQPQPPAKERETMDRETHVGITRDDFDQIVYRASQGSEEALSELRQVLRANPAIYRLLGDVSRHAQQRLSDQIASESVLMGEALRQQLAELRAQLLADFASPLEQLLVEQVVTTWLDWHVQQIGFGQPHSRKGDAEHWEQRAGRAQKRHLAAVQALGELRNRNSVETRCNQQQEGAT